VCYSLSLYSDVKTLMRRFEARPAEGLSVGRAYYVSAFAFPEIPVIANEAPGLIQAFRWGLVPAWVDSETRANEIRKKTLNARFETLFRRPSFKEAVRKRRCLVLADGFFEFREVGGRKYPYFIHLRSGEPLALAGLWEAWRHPRTGRMVKTFSIVTVPANPLLARIHNTKKRMPLILVPEVERAWLDRPLKEGEIWELTARFDESMLEAYPVSRRIASRNVDGTRMALLERRDYPGLEGDQS